MKEHAGKSSTSIGAIAAESLGPTITVGEILLEIMATTVGDGFLEAQSLSGPFRPWFATAFPL